MSLTRLSKRVKILQQMAPDLKGLVDLIKDGTFAEVLTAPDEFIDDFFAFYKELVNQKEL